MLTPTAIAITEVKQAYVGFAILLFVRLDKAENIKIHPHKNAQVISGEENIPYTLYSMEKAWFSPMAFVIRPPNAESIDITLANNPDNATAWRIISTFSLSLDKLSIIKKVEIKKINSKISFVMNWREISIGTNTKVLRDNDCFFIVLKIMKTIKIVSIDNEKSRLLTLFPQIINEKIRTDIKRLIAFSKVYLLFLKQISIKSTPCSKIKAF